ncbi:sensor histidine kinase [Ideonella margarita]|uniref:histidine kinase n=1 Tax=Ideonella margarita TaxID=2984191 RepID=A0ABU9C1S9_9BURK
MSAQQYPGPAEDETPATANDISDLPPPRQPAPLGAQRTEDTGSEDQGQPGLPPGAAGLESMVRIGWRRQALLLAAVIGCLTVFLLARAMANLPHLPAEWRSSPEGRLELIASPVQALQAHIGAELDGIREPDGQITHLNVLALAHSARWITEDALRHDLLAARVASAKAVEAGKVTLVFWDGSEVPVATRPRGYGALGAMFWLMCGFAMVLFLVGWIVPLVHPRFRNWLYAVMAHAQATQLLLGAVSSVPALALPVALVAHESVFRTLLDLVTCGAILHAAASRSSLWQNLLVAGMWVGVGTYGALALGGVLAHEWWWAQGLMLLTGLLCIGLLSWANRVSPHPFAVVMRRFCLVTEASLLLLSLAVAMMPLMPPEMQPVAAVAPVIWGVFFASLILLVPFIARSQNVMREFAMLAGISTVATSVDLLFVAAFSFSQFASLTLSLFLALGAYAALRQWLVSQMMGARALTTERMFEHLYRIAREVEARPERAADRMIELLRNVFEPLETSRGEGRAQYSRILGNGAVLLVPLPNLMHGPAVDGLVTLRFAERGKRLFTPEDARLADRILEQLMRALAHDRAVERGRSEERVRIAQDLHDDIGARLLTLMYKAPSKEMEDYVRHTLQDLKTLTRGLAAKKHALTLASAEWKTDIAQRLSAIGCELVWQACYDDDITLTMVQWSSLTRILRELVSNVISHSNAKSVQIQCRLNQGTFTIDLIDDGSGRTPEKWSHGLGLGGIRKRVKLMGGTVTWREREERGIVCQVVIPELTSPGSKKAAAC